MSKVDIGAIEKIEQTVTELDHVTTANENGVK